MRGKRDTYPARLIAAAMAARDDLRSRAIPGLERLRALVGDRPEAAGLVERLYALTVQHADGLLHAIKGR